MAGIDRDATEKSRDRGRESRDRYDGEQRNREHNEER
jgi:hypothetical protein